MSFQEDFAEFLDMEQGFAVSAVLTPAFGLEYVISGIMGEEYFDIDSGMAGVKGSKPMFECAEEDIAEVEYSGDYEYIRIINKPVNNNICRIYIDSMLLESGYSIDFTTGIISFDHPPRCCIPSDCYEAKREERYNLNIVNECYYKN